MSPGLSVRVFRWVMRIAVVAIVIVSVLLLVRMFHPGYMPINHIFRPMTSQRDKVTAVIVEEHHEVLPYWFHAVESGRIARGKPLTLAAVAAGMFDRLVWVWPHWLKNTSSPFYGDHMTGMVHLGIFNYTEEESKESLDGICLCIRETLVDGQPAVPLQDEEGRPCLFAKQELEPYHGLDAICRVRRKVRFDYISHSHILKHADNLINEGKSPQVIIDIDEDYFGCERGSTPITEAGIDWQVIETINEVLKRLFCPRTIQDERQLHSSLTTLLRQPRDCIKTAQCSSHLPLLEPIACPEINLKQQIPELVGLARSKLKPGQLRRVLEVGFCLLMTPNTTMVALDEVENSIEVCTGNSGPDSRNSEYYSPTASEITQEMKGLQTMVRTVSNARLVTICRSNRDGYVPRRHLEQIEAGIIQAIKPMTAELVCDPNLMTHLGNAPV